MSILQNLTEGIVNRDLSREGEAILNKWEKTGLLEGLEGDFNRNQMAVLLENQAKELLRESNSMAGGDVEGFAAVAFPIVRRVFGGLLAQKLVSVQPMSLPSGLVFFMDFVKQAPETGNSQLDHDASRDGVVAATSRQAGFPGAPSVYGGNVVASGLEGGVTLNGDQRAAGQATPQFYDLIQGHSAARGDLDITLDANGGMNDNCDIVAITLDGTLTPEQLEALEYDPDLISITDSSVATVVTLDLADLNAATNAGGSAEFPRCVRPDARHIEVTAQNGAALGDNQRVVRRLSKFVQADPKGAGTPVDCLKLVILGGVAVADTNPIRLEFALADNFVHGANTDLGSVMGASAWEMEGSAALPEIAIKVDSTAITAVTRKLKASWTPELAQDLNAYHNLDAEVELTGILSEQIALEIDQEILSDLIAGASASKLYWSRRPGLFVNRETGRDATSLQAPPDFTGSVSEWYETLVETINDVSADIHRKTLRGGANFLVCGPEVANILEFTSGFRASVTHDDATGSVGAVQIGSINKKWDLHVDPYFPRNVILVGRKGGSFLESGFVYAPYVPLQVTPTIFDADDFTPRKAVMTRYGKKMVRPDMYGLVVVRDLEG